MSKRFTYSKIRECVYLENSDEYDEICEKFEYEVEDNKIIEALASFVYKEYFLSTNNENVKDGLFGLIKEFDLIDNLFDYYLDELKEYFKAEAFEYYED